MCFIWDQLTTSLLSSVVFFSIFYIRNCAVVITVSILPRIFCSSILFSKLFWIVPKSRIMISITVNCIFLEFFCSLARYRYLPIFSLSFIFTLSSAGTVKSTSWQVLFFLLINARFDFLVGIWWSDRISKLQRFLCVSFAKTFWFVD